MSNTTTLSALRPSGASDVCQGWERAEGERTPLVPAQKSRHPSGVRDYVGVQTRSAPSLLILKLGGSILTGDSDLSLAVHEIYRHFRAGTRVIAVVSALHGTTDRLMSRARRFTNVPSDASLSALLSTGELTSAALLTLACERAGLPARTLDAAQIQLRAAGPTLDASPTSVNTSIIRAALETTPILIIPGFIARDSDNSPTLLGRGGSDLTALFLARELSAPCRLLKDVPGIYERDPNTPTRATVKDIPPRLPRPNGANGCSRGGGWSAAEPVGSLREIDRPGRGGGEVDCNPDPEERPRRYQSLSFSDLDSLNAKVVQPRTATFARENQIEFEVGAPLSDECTTIGTSPTAFADSVLSTRSSALRIALLGHGTVGAGAAQTLRRLPDQFTLTSIAVRDPAKHINRHLPRRLFTTDPFTAIQSDADIVIELIGGLNPAYELIKQSLASGKHVITANKAVTASHGDELRTLAAASDVQLLYSAAVGGSLPILETARRLHETSGLTSLEAILNGATNFILTQVENGSPLPAAITQAQSRGLTEADPTRDLSGQDALDKLIVIAQELWPDLPLRTTLISLPQPPQSPEPGTRQVARLSRSPHSIHLRVAPEIPPPSSLLARCAHENNSAIFTTADGHQHTLTGKGAGRYPTTESILADLLTLAKTPTLTSASC